VSGREFHVETDAGVLSLEVLRDDGDRTAKVRMDLGAPRLDRAAIPMTGEVGHVVEEAFEAAGEKLKLTAVSMGNPHAVVYVKNAERYPVRKVGAAIENHERFPNRVNVEFVEVKSPGEVIQRTWERGAGETLACGTGAAAVAVAGILTGNTGSPLIVHLLGGDLLLEWDGEGPVFQTGPATVVFTGDWPD
jgi:diaminopimelate epimerase